MLRSEPSGIFKNFLDLEAVEEDAINVKKGVIGLGAQNMDIVMYEDTNFEALTALFRELTRRVANAGEIGRETTFIFVYYSGHGV